MNECNIRFDRKKENNKIKRRMKERKMFVKKTNKERTKNQRKPIRQTEM